MNEQSIRWDDLRIVRAIAIKGSLSGAGRELGLSHATIFRRLADAESRLGVRLFERAQGGYTPTLAGEDLAAVAGRVESDILGAERRLAGKDLTLSGTLRVATTDTLFHGLLAGPIESFRQSYPDISLEVSISNQQQSLSKREADLAIRPTRNPPETLVGRRIGDVQLAVYGRRKAWESQADNLPNVDQQSWIGPDTHMGDPLLEEFMNHQGRNERCRYRVDSMLGMQAALRHSDCVGLLPCYLGDANPQLLRLTPPIETLVTPLWLLTHPDLRHLARIRTFMDDITEAIRGRL